MNLSKLRLLAGVATSNPPEFADRVRAVVEVQADRFLHTAAAYPDVPWDQVLRGLSGALGVDAAGIDREVDDRTIDSTIAEGIARLGPSPQFALRHNADARIARLCYIACRARRPDTVIETGVAYGVTTTFVLTALEVNGRGRLHSIDLPPLGTAADAAVGALVPDQLRARWTLHRGASRRILPPLLAQLGTVDMFIHDSLHTSRTMRWEFETAHRHGGRPFVLLADDIELNRAFEEFVAAHRTTLAFQATCAASAKDARAGVGIFEASAG